MDWALIRLAAKRAQAAYIIDAGQAKAAFEALGDTWIGQYQDDDSQAVLSVDPPGALCLSISGTRFSAGKIGDLFDDVQLAAVDVGGGAKVTRGAYESAAEIWQWALKSAPQGAIFNVCGHSLGGWRATYTPLFIPAAQIGALHAFEPPKAANLAFYKKFAKELSSMVTVGQGRDIWFGYPRFGEWIHRPGEMIWLQDKGFSVIDTSAWPGGFSLDDHSIDLEVNRINEIAASAVAA